MREILKKHQFALKEFKLRLFQDTEIICRCCHRAITDNLCVGIVTSEVPEDWHLNGKDMEIRSSQAGHLLFDSQQILEWAIRP